VYIEHVASKKACREHYIATMRVKGHPTPHQMRHSGLQNAIEPGLRY
jgi:hypothetical protein